MPNKENKKNHRPFYLILAALVILILCFSFVDICPLFELIHPSFKINNTTISNFIRDLGPWGPAGSIGLMIIHSFVPFPAEILTFTNGMVYGPVWGVVITWIGAMLGAFASFALTKHYGRPFVEKKVNPSQLKKIDRWVQNQGVWSLLLSRLIPLISFNLINYGAGITSVSWWTFAWTTAIGILPMTIIMVTIGNNVDIIPWWGWGIVLGAIIGTAYIVIVIRQKK